MPEQKVNGTDKITAKTELLLILLKILKPVLSAEPYTLNPKPLQPYTSHRPARSTTAVDEPAANKVSTSAALRFQSSAGPSCPRSPYLDIKKPTFLGFLIMISCYMGGCQNYGPSLGP